MRSLALLFFLLLLLLLAFQASASHFRYAYVSWEKISGGSNCVRFTLTTGWRTGGTHYLYFGDGGGANLPMNTIQSGNDALGNAFIIYQGTYDYCYPSKGPYTAYYTSCCRIGGLQNSGETDFGWSTIVDLNSGNKYSPISAVPATVTIPVSSTYQLPVPLIDGDGDTVTCSLVSGTSTSPSGYSNSNFALTIDSSTCVLTVSNLASIDMLIAVTVSISDNHRSGAAISTLDFIIITTGSITGSPPSCSQITPNPVYVAPGGLANINFQVNDPDGGSISIAHQGPSPTGLTYAPASVTAGNQFTATYSPPVSWVDPATSGSFLITDNTGQFALCLYSFIHASLSVTISSTSATCNTISSCGTATLTATASDGVSPYSYLWNTGANSNPVVVSNAGMYSVTVTDSAGSTDSDSITISKTPAQAHTLAPPPVLGTCGGQSIHISSCSTGRVLTFSRSGGCGNLQVDIPGISSAVTVSGSSYTFPVSSAGTYQAHAVDADGCQAYSNTVTVNQRGAVTGSVQVSGDGLLYDIRVYGTATASASFLVSSGCGPYSYSWSTGASSSSISSLAAGSYSLTVTDVFGCPSVFNFVVTQSPSPLSVSFSIPSSTTCGHVGQCFGDQNGEILVTPSGGSGGYSISWTSSSSTPPSNGDFNPTSLDDGTYQFTVTDSNGESYTSPVIGLAEPTDLVVTLDNNPNSWVCNSMQCFGDNDGELVLTVSGGCSPYTITWSGPTPIPAGTLNPTSLSPGSYTATIVDSNGCTEILSTTISQPAALQVSAIANTVGSCGQHITCKGSSDGSISSSVSGGCGSSSVLWSPSGQTVANPTGLSAGVHSYVYTDLNGCQIGNSFTLLEPTNSLGVSLSLTACGNLISTVTGGTLCGSYPSYIYSWSYLSDDGSSSSCPSMTANTPNQSGELCDGRYTVVVTDGNGCSVSASRVVQGLYLDDGEFDFNSGSWTQMSGNWALSSNVATQTDSATGLLAMLRFNDAQAFSVPGISGEFRTPISGNSFGLILGYNTGNSHYYMLEWMGLGGPTSCGSTQSGLRLLSVPTTATTCQIRSRTGGVTVLQSASGVGSVSWSAATSHTFTVSYSGYGVFVSIDGESQIAFYGGGSEPQPLDGDIILFTNELSGVSFSNIAMDSASSSCPNPTLVTISKSFLDSVTCNVNSYLIKVVWGDGEIDTYGSSVITSFTALSGGVLEVSHEYQQNGVYNVQICISSNLQTNPSCDTVQVSVNEIVEILSGLSDDMRWNMYIPKTITWNTVNVLPHDISIDWYFTNSTHFRNIGLANTAEGSYDSIGPYNMYTGEYLINISFNAFTCSFKDFPILVHVRTGDWDPL